jgi:DNA polymerase elongation subunit (family B)
MKIEYLGEYETDLYDISVEDNMNFFANDILVHNCDTDSVYLNMAPLIEKVFGTTEVDRKTGEEFLDDVCKTKIEKVLQEGYEELSNFMGAYRNAMSMKREKITDRSLFVAKKRYIMNVLNSEGVHYETPKISVTGIEAVRSSTPEICRNKMKESFKVIMSGKESEVQAYIENFRQEFSKLPVEEISKISGTDDIEKYMEGKSYKKGCPMHVRGCIVYNNVLKSKGLDKKYDLIGSGDKIKFVYLKMPNSVGENVISFPNVLPPELDLHKYIDYELQFEKLFLLPIDAIVKSIGWNAKKVDNLEGFFM